MIKAVVVLGIVATAFIIYDEIADICNSLSYQRRKKQVLELIDQRIENIRDYGQFMDNPEYGYQIAVLNVLLNELKKIEME